MNPIDIKDFLQRSADQIGFVREKFEDRKIPSDRDNIVVMPFFGDIRHAFILSSILLKRYREEIKGSKYFIFCSWPGFQGMFPYVDEYWSLNDISQYKKMYQNAEEFKNRSDITTLQLRSFNERFREVIDCRDFSQYYTNGIKQAFWDRFKHIKRFLPMVPSSAILGKDFNRDLAIKAGYKVFLSPSMFASTWKLGKQVMIPVGKLFWSSLVKYLIRAGFVPVLWKHDLSYDLSAEFTDKCVYVVEKDIAKVLGVMRAVGCTLDVFNGTSRLAIAARSPYVAVDERQRYMETKEWEIDDLCGNQIPKEYIFSFATIIEDANQHGWDQHLFGNIVARLNEFLPELNRDNWPTTGESLDIVPYETVRKRKIKKIGAKLLKITPD